MAIFEYYALEDMLLLSMHTVPIHNQVEQGPDCIYS